MKTARMVAFLSLLAIASQASTVPPLAIDTTSEVTKPNADATSPAATTTRLTTAKPLPKTTVIVSQRASITARSVTYGTTDPSTVAKTQATTPEGVSTAKFITERQTTAEYFDATTTGTKVPPAVSSTSVKQTTSTTAAEVIASTSVPVLNLELAPVERGYPARTPSRLDERLEALDCDIPLLPAESRLWRGNETHELMLPITVSNFNCMLFVLKFTALAAAYKRYMPFCTVKRNGYYNTIVINWK